MLVLCVWWQRWPGASAAWAGTPVACILVLLLRSQHPEQLSGCLTCRRLSKEERQRQEKAVQEVLKGAQVGWGSLGGRQRSAAQGRAGHPLLGC